MIWINLWHRSKMPQNQIWSRSKFSLMGSKTLQVLIRHSHRSCQSLESFVSLMRTVASLSLNFEKSSRLSVIRSKPQITKKRDVRWRLLKSFNKNVDAILQEQRVTLKVPLNANTLTTTQTEKWPEDQKWWSSKSFEADLKHSNRVSFPLNWDLEKSLRFKSLFLPQQEESRLVNHNWRWLRLKLMIWIRKIGRNRLWGNLYWREWSI